MMPPQIHFALVALLLPITAFLLLALVRPLRLRGRTAGIVSAAFAVASLVASLLAAHDGIFAQRAGEAARWAVEWLPSAAGPIATIGVLADPNAALMLVLVALVAALVQIYSLGYLHDEPPASLGRYYAYQSLFAFSMMGLVLAPNLVQLFICWELVGLCSYLLIGYWYRKPEAARAAVKAFWTTKAGDVGLLIGIVLLWRHAGTLELVELQQLAERGNLQLAGLSIITLCMYMGAAGKSAQIPFHVWLPDAMEGPTPVSALIHAATMVTAGVYLLFRTAWLFALTPDVLVLVGWIGAATALMAAVLACVQTDIKRVLAYSTVSQLGYMMTAIGAGYADAGFFHLLTHGVFKALLFLGAGAVIHAVGTNDMRDMGQLVRRMPQTTIVFVVGTLSLAGIPLFAGFLSKEEILGATLAGGLTGPFVMLIVAAFLTAFYMGRVMVLTFFGHAHPTERGSIAMEGGHGHQAPHDAPAIMSVPLWLLAALSLLIGVATLFMGGPFHFTFQPPHWLTFVAVSVAAGGLLLAWLTYQRKIIAAETLAASFGPLRRAALAGFGFDAAFLAVYRGVLLSLAAVIGWIDRYLVDGVVNVASAITVGAGDRLRHIQTGRVQDYFYGVTLGLLMLLVWIGWSL
jgi:NADH-quinone oxidoreductase subunit L